MIDQIADLLGTVADRLRDARRVAVLTGAGVSAESGIPTFRDALTGLWAKFDPMELATPEAFERDPELVTRWYDWRRVSVLGCEPNAGHRALARIQNELEHRGGSLTLVTQNVDGLHERGGSAEVVRLHGSLLDWRCVACGAVRREDGPGFDRYPPVCECGGKRRPGVVWFGELLPADAMAAAERAVAECDVFLSIGTSAVVYPAAALIPLAMRSGAYTAEINPEPTHAAGRFDVVIGQPASGVLDRLADLAFNG